MRHHRALPLSRRRAQCGFSLIELMVSITIGFAVVGALLAAYLAAAQSGRANSAMVQMSEDANIALNVLRSQVAMAGYYVPTGIGASGFTGAMTGKSKLFGCNGAAFGASSALPIDSLGLCGAANAASPDTLAVAYQVDVVTAGTKKYSNGVLNGAVPYDCVGNAIVPTTGTYFADSHFYLATPAGGTNTALYCRQGDASGGAVAGQPVAENIKDLQVKYMLGASATTTARQATYFSDGPTTSPVAATWANVVAVRICVEVVSEKKQTDAFATSVNYLDCKDAPQKATDGLMHRAFTTTVALQP